MVKDHFVLALATNSDDSFNMLLIASPEMDLLTINALSRLN